MTNLFTRKPPLHAPHAPRSSQAPTRQTRQTLAQRRKCEKIRRALLAAFVAILVWLVLFCVTDRAGSIHILAAAHAITAGSEIDESDVKLIDIAAAPTTTAVPAGLLHTSHSAASRFARIDIAQGEPILESELSDTPLAPKDYTTISIPVASNPLAFAVGQEVSVIARCPATASEPADSTPRPCTLAKEAIFLGLHSDSGNPAAPANDTGSGFSNLSTVTLAVKSQQALAILSSIEKSPLLLVQ
jgi:hypothetical protein